MDILWSSFVISHFELGFWICLGDSWPVVLNMINIAKIVGFLLIHETCYIIGLKHASFVQIMLLLSKEWKFSVYHLHGSNFIYSPFQVFVFI